MDVLDFGGLRSELAPDRSAVLACTITTFSLCIRRDQPAVAVCVGRDSWSGFRGPALPRQGVQACSGLRPLRYGQKQLQVQVGGYTES